MTVFFGKRVGIQKQLNRKDRKDRKENAKEIMGNTTRSSSIFGVGLGAADRPPALRPFESAGA